MFLRKYRIFGMKNAGINITETGHYDHNNILANVKVMI